MSEWVVTEALMYLLVICSSTEVAPLLPSRTHSLTFCPSSVGVTN